MTSVPRCNWINQNGVQCGQPLGHLCGHSNGLLTTPQDAWHSYLGATVPPLPTVEKSGVVWTDKSVVTQCLWTGARGRCIYEQGHTIGHKEATGHAQ